MPFQKQTVWLVVKVELEVDVEKLAKEEGILMPRDAYDIADLFVGNCDYEISYQGSGPKLESAIEVTDTVIASCETSCPI